MREVGPPLLLRLQAAEEAGDLERVQECTGYAG